MAATQLTTPSPLAVKSLPSFEGLRSAEVITNVNFSPTYTGFKSRLFRGLVVNAASVSAVKPTCPSPFAAVLRFDQRAGGAAYPRTNKPNLPRANKPSAQPPSVPPWCVYRRCFRAASTVVQPPPIATLQLFVDFAGWPIMASGPSEPSPCSTTPNMETTTPTPTLTSNTDANVDSCGTLHGTEDEGDTLVLGKQRKFISKIWKHYNYEVIGGVPKAICKYCKKKLDGASKNGTTHLRVHYKSCPMKRHMDIVSDFTQKKLKIESSDDKKGQVLFVNGFDEEFARNELAYMVIMHEYPLSMVEHIGFRRYSKALQPSFTMISRNTLRKDILKVFDFEKGKTMKMLASVQSKIAITTDMWTAQNQKRGFISITAHWIDGSWKLQNRILRFACVPCPHTAESISEELLKCFSEWNINRKLSSLTVDNCSCNDAIISIVKNRLDLRALPLRGEFFHMRCCAHILNIIVKDGLEVIESSIEKIRDSIAYWRATPKREETFREVCDSLGVPYSKKLKLDCKTRWNSTFLMLQTALLYREVFPKLAKRDSNYKSLPTDEEWEKAKDIYGRLQIFYDVIQLFSSTSFPTANIYFPIVFQVRLTLSRWLHDPNAVIRVMAQKMLDKFLKYWDVIYGILGVACVLDPRFKLKMVEVCYSSIFGSDIDDKVDMIKDICYALFHEYQEKYKHLKAPIPDTSGDSTKASLSVSDSSGGVSYTQDIFEIYYTLLEKESQIPQKSELDFYLEEAVIPRTDNFDILVHWKTATRYPILALIARDIYAVPVSTVASESVFSTGGRFMSPHRNRLHPKTLEALMCARDWLWSTVKSVSEDEDTVYCHGTFDQDYDAEVDEEFDD